MGPLEFFENENFDARAPKIWIWTSKIMPDLWLSAVFCQIKKKSLHPTGQRWDIWTALGYLNSSGISEQCCNIWTALGYLDSAEWGQFSKRNFSFPTK